MNGRWHVHLAGEQKIPWALDEDLRWVRKALGGPARFTSFPFARIVHAAWWPALLSYSPAALRNKIVICFADNPPAFYLTQRDFSAAAQRVDCWVARSREAFEQFRALDLRVGMAPYCADPAIFRPLPEAAAAIRSKWGIPADAFVVGNFHRDSEGADLARPKMQKGPDIFLEIAVRLVRQAPRTMVLLAGPRRHWLLRQLRENGIPHVFAGKPPSEADDYERNILDRSELNELYQALDVTVISSRWEGGPYTVLEALLAGRPVISSPVGMARDVLPETHIYRSPEEAAALLAAHAASGMLAESTARARGKALQEHTGARLRENLLGIYAEFPRGGVGAAHVIRSASLALMAKMMPRPWERRTLPVNADGPSASTPAGLIAYDWSRPRESLEECVRLVRSTQAR